MPRSALILISVIVLLLAACDSSSSSETDGNGEPTTVDSPVPTATDAPNFTATANAGELTATAIVLEATNAPQSLPSVTMASANTASPGQLTATAIVAAATANAGGGGTTGLFTPGPAVTCVPGLFSRPLTALSEQIRTGLEQNTLKVSFVDVFVTDVTQDCVTITHQSTTYRIGLTLADIPTDASAPEVVEGALQVLSTLPNPPGTAPATLEIGLQVFSGGAHQWERWVIQDYGNALNAWAAGQRGTDLLRILGGLHEL